MNYWYNTHLLAQILYRIIGHLGKKPQTFILIAVTCIKAMYGTHSPFTPKEEKRVLATMMWKPIFHYCFKEEKSAAIQGWIQRETWGTLPVTPPLDRLTRFPSAHINCDNEILRADNTDLRYHIWTELTMFIQQR